MIRRRSVDIANELRLKRSQHRGTFLLLEGRDDRLLYERLTDRQRSKIEVVEGKEKVLEVTRMLGDAGFNGIVGIVDADFDRVLGSVPTDPNICLNDTHDLESMLVRSHSLEGVLVEFASAQKLERLGRDVRDVLLQAATPIGWLRLLSVRLGLNLTFDGLRYSRFVNQRTLAVDLKDLISEVKARSQRQDLPTPELRAGMEAIAHEVQQHSSWEICAGSDLVEVLSVGLRRAFGTNDARAVSEEQLRRALRLSYNDPLFQQSDLRRSLTEWEHRNPPYHLL